MKTNYRLLKISFALIMFLFLQVGFTPSPADINIEIKVSPNVLNLENQGDIVTVHTDIAYSIVISNSVLLNDVPIDWWKSDDRGNFVAKFEMADIKNLPLDIGGYNTLTLIGETKDGDTFIGSQEILVIKNIPVGGKK